MRALESIRDDVTFKLPYDFGYHMKTPMYSAQDNVIIVLVYPFQIFLDILQRMYKPLRYGFISLYLCHNIDLKYAFIAASQ